VRHLTEREVSPQYPHLAGSQSKQCAGFAGSAAARIITFRTIFRFNETSEVIGARFMLLNWLNE
jgi:hypothetical protein